MLLNCGVREDSWESLGLQGDPPSPSSRISVLGVHWKDWCWSWNSNTLATSWEELTHWKRLWCWEGLGSGGEGGDRGWDGWMASPTRWTWVSELLELVMDREAWRAAIHGVAKSRTRPSDWTELNDLPKLNLALVMWLFWSFGLWVNIKHDKGAETWKMLPCCYTRDHLTHIERYMFQSGPCFSSWHQLTKQRFTNDQYLTANIWENIPNTSRSTT